MKNRLLLTRDRRPDRKSSHAESDALDRGLAAAVSRSSQSVGEKIEAIIREKYPSIGKSRGHVVES
ncbi:hypothetical protein V1291_005277 [Nitrobacteraceae bacterium AZCC 1564]